MKPFIVAHRGWTAGRHENTLAAFAAAIELGVDYVECDVRRSVDGVLFIHHDPQVGLLRTESSTMSALREEGRKGGVAIPTLADLLAMPLGGTRIDFELKEPGCEREFAEAALQALPSSQFVVTSFIDACLRSVKEIDAEIRCGLLLGSSESAPLATRLRELFPAARASAARADFIAPHWKLLRFGFARRARMLGLPLWVWTVNDPMAIDRLLESENVEGIVTDVPDVAMTRRAKSGQR